MLANRPTSGPSGTATRVVIIDDGRLNRECLAAQFRANDMCVDVAWDLPSLFGQIDAGRPDVILFPTAVQLPDGSIDNGSRIEPPVVYVDVTTERGLTAAQARALGAALVDAAALLDRWEQFTPGD